MIYAMLKAEAEEDRWDEMPGDVKADVEAARRILKEGRHKPEEVRNK